MLIQHLLTKRLIREVFDNPEFTRRNVIAAEVEKVIDALTSRSFNRDTFLKSRDRSSSRFRSTSCSEITGFGTRPQFRLR